MSTQTPEDLKRFNLRNEAISVYALATQRAISKLSAAIGATGIRTRIDPFIRFVSSSMAKTNGTEFPTTRRPHRLNQERHVHFGKVNTLIFHVANAVQGFYDLVNLPLNQDDSEAQEILDARISLLNLIADIGLQNCTLDGDDSTGFHITHLKIEQKLRPQDAVSPDEQVQGERPAGA